MSLDAVDRVALVTGAGRGLGAGIAQALGRAGYRVAVGFCTSREDAERIASGLAGARAFHVDVGDPDSVVAASSAIRAEMGPIDVLVNNAGIAQERPFLQLTDADWEHMLSVNLLGAVRCVRQVLPHMLARNWGRIVNISSIGGQWGGMNQLHYAASKAGLINFTRSIAKLHSAQGITSNAIAPGLIATEMSAAELDSEAGQQKVAGIPAARLGTVQEIGETTAFLCSDGAAYITGQTLNLNGGMLFD
ncbi:MAG: NAD(P)-dependent dehydrogenase (short-subunit alcohol dehydrogenase family) [Chlamydiales bacterium]|jgi:NAD(P)-dependent dehydrogenase (short-subunit alcohol dehydrogenase family)